MVPLLQAQRAPAWIAGWTLNAVALRGLTAWLYNSTGKSLFAAILFHAMVNLSTFRFPVTVPTGIRASAAWSLRW